MTESHREVLRRSLAWTLPEPVTPDEASILRVDRTVTVSHSPAAVIALGQTGQPGLELVGVEGLPARERLRLMPSIGVPRALLPERDGRKERRVLVRARSTALSPLQRIELAVARGGPSRVLNLVSAPIEVATARRSQLAYELRRLLPEARLGVVLNPSNYGRPAIFAFDAQGRAAAVAKFATERTDRLRQSREWELLGSLRRIASLEGTTPQPLARVFGHLGDALVTEPLLGAPAPLVLNRPLAGWLADCRQRGEIHAGRSPLVRRLLDDLEEEGNALLLSAAYSACTRLEEVAVPITVVHGDFVPWNVVLDKGSVRVFDWEWGSLEGIPEWDAIYFRLHVGLVSNRWTSEQLVAAIRMLAEHPVEPYAKEEYRQLLLLVLVHLTHVIQSSPRHAEVARNVIEGLTLA